MRKLNYLWLALLFASITNFGFAQQGGNIRGRVIDTDNLALPGATILVEGRTRGTITDTYGFFTLSDLPAGSYSLEVTYIGFLPETALVTVESGKTASVDIRLIPGLAQLQEVIITGQLQGQSKALNTQMNKPNITNIISSDQVGRFPDANIGDALKRIPGINVQYDQGEARFGNFRGTSPQYNSVMINGERIPSAEAEDRTVQLDLVPADMVQAIEVNKAVTPDMDGDAIGGSVNLITRAAPFERRISATLGSGYNLVAEKPMLNGSFIFGDRFASNKLGLILSASYHNHRIGSDNVEAEWDYMDEDDKEGTSFFEELQVRQYFLQRVRQSYSLALDYNINANHTLFASGMYNWRNDWENRYRTIYKDIEFDEDANIWNGVIEKETKGGTGDIKNARLEDQRMMNFAFGGDHQLGKMKMDWTASLSQASEERPNERYIVYEVEEIDEENLTFNPDFDNQSQPSILSVSPSSAADFSSAYELGELTEQFQYTEDIDRNFRLNLLIPMLENGYANSLKVGVRYRGKTKMRDNKLFEYEPVDADAFTEQVLNNLSDLTRDNYLAGDYQTGNQVSNSYLGDLDLASSLFEEGEEVIEEQAGNFNATENILGGYLMLNQNIGSSLFLIAGVRFENTSQEYQGNQFEIDEEGEEEITETPKISDSYLSILPGLHLKYNFNQTTILRAAWTNTIARPNYFALVPYREINREDGDEIAIGNPDLTPTKSMNLDLMFEKYFRTIGIISAGIFYKDIKDFIVEETREDFLFEGREYSTFTQSINGGNAQLFGFEIAGQHPVSFIPGVSIYGNYTYTTSSVSDFQVEGREDDEISLPGTAEHTINGSIAYDGKKFTFRTSLNYASAFVDEFGEEAFYDRYYDSATYLDVNASYAINPNLRIYVEGINLLNQPLRYYQGVSSRLMQTEFYNVRFQMGVKMDL